MHFLTGCLHLANNNVPLLKVTYELFKNVTVLTTINVFIFTFILSSTDFCLGVQRPNLTE